MALAEALHHSAGPSTKKVVERSEGGEEVEYETNYAAPRGQNTPPPGMRPASHAEPQGAQELVQRHIMQQSAEFAPMVQILDALVLQLVNKLEDVLKIVDLFVPVQEIVAPKILSLSRPTLRRVLPVPQLAEQLVDLPLPATGVVQAWVRDANHQRWSRVWDSTEQVYWWHPASGHVQWNTPLEITASPGRKINTWQLRIFLRALVSGSRLFVVGLA